MDFSELSQKMSELQHKMQDIDEKLKAIEVTRESGAGLVKATFSGSKKMLRLEIDDQLLVKQEKEMLQDLIMAAVNLAIDEVEERTKGETQRASLDLFSALK